MLTEQEVLSKHREALKDGAEACRWLAKNADPEWKMPRARHYRTLKIALKELEGSCRQMQYLRFGDTRWLRLSMVYAKAIRDVQQKFRTGRWLYFQDLIKLFELGERRLLELDMKTGIPAGPILPKRPSDFLILPPMRANAKGTLH